jgi:uncharacterized protein YggE
MKELKIPFFTIFFIFIFLFLFTKFASPIPLFVHSLQTTKNNLFTVDGTGKATAVPNTAFINFGITKNATTVIDAQSQTNSTANTIFDALKKLSIDTNNIKTVNYSLNPNYDFSLGKQTINGYSVTQNVELKIKPVDMINNVVDTLTTSGANIIGNITFGFDDETQKQLENQARQEAIQNAKEKAQSITSAAGIHLGKIVDVQENNSFPRPLPILGGFAAAKAIDQSQQTSVTPGQNDITVTVTLSYETY